MKKIINIYNQITNIIFNKDKIISSIHLREYKINKVFFNKIDHLYNVLIIYKNLEKNKLELEKKIKNKNSNFNIKKNLLEVRKIKNKLIKENQIILNLYDKIHNIIDQIPNILDKKVKKDDIIIKTNENNFIKQNNNYKYNYRQICNKINNFIDFDKASIISGPRHLIYKEKGYLLFQSLRNFFLDYAIKLGYTPILCPLIIKNKSAFNCGLLPKFSNEIFETTNNFFLIPTAESSLINLHINEKLRHLPKKYVSFTPCFRREAGNYGKNSGGLIRLHQFYKCELVIFSEQKNSEEMHQIMLNDIISLVEQLNFKYRIILNSAINTAFQSYKTYDTEAWMFGSKRFLEISSCSNTLNFQSSRTNTVDKNGNFVHIINGSCLPIERIISIILEQNQNKNYVIIPNSLKKYLNKDKLLYK